MLGPAARGGLSLMVLLSSHNALGHYVPELVLIQFDSRMAARCLLLLVCFALRTRFIVHSLKINVTRTTPHEIEGESTSFTCTADGLGYGFLQWILDGTPLDSTPCFGSQDRTRLCLDLTLYRNDSGKTLTCTSVGEYKNTDTTLRLNALHPPDVVTLEANTTSGLIYKFNCTASGANPAVKITWLVNINDVQSREVIVSRQSPAPYMWTTSSCITLYANTIADDGGVRCMTSFLDNDSYVVREFLLDANIIKGTNFIAETLTTQTSTSRSDEETSTDSSVDVKVYVIVIISVIVCLCVAIVIFWRYHHKPKPRQPPPPLNKATKWTSAECVELEETGFQLPDVDYSFPRENIQLLEVLGCGNFGQVHKAIAKDLLEVGTKTLVAVKILKKSSSCHLLADFEKEISVHKTLTKHSNVVSMLGYCTDRDPFYLILEFLPGGNLQDFLKKKKLSWKESRQVDFDVEPASPFQLLTFASQIANGMDYLSFKGCIHRDLASRNILLTDDLVCKLSDFGLARDVSATEQYEMASKGLLPVRWLAMECLVDNTYTTMSDVWSFGVLLWEIVTLGAHPYRGMSYNDIIDCLVEGHRLPQPRHCSKQLFSIMKECWREVPRTRPTFLSLKRTLDVMIEDAPVYVNMANFQPDKYII
ncbi:uncharacterized protein [Asterias amurensis]|uniref:uncharacterized protein n=1 Tax=Asterias amurensis TaxID=7602 RepID=UPI003AB2F608